MAKGARKVTARKIAPLADAAARRALRGGVAVLPVGSMEQHGAHLNVSTDAEIAHAVSELVCAKNRYILLPTIHYGVSFEHAPALNLSVRASTLRATVSDIAASLADARARALVVINGHYGNGATLERLPPRIRSSSRHSIRCIVLPYWQFMSREFDHAGHVETSIMLTRRNVNMRAAKKGFVEPAGLDAAKRRALARQASRSFLSVAKNGVWGDPRHATRAEGNRLLEEIATNLAKECRQKLRSRA